MDLLKLAAELRHQEISCISTNWSLTNQLTGWQEMGLRQTMTNFFSLQIMGNSLIQHRAAIGSFAGGRQARTRGTDTREATTEDQTEFHDYQPCCCIDCLTKQAFETVRAILTGSFR